MFGTGLLEKKGHFPQHARLNPFHTWRVKVSKDWGWMQPRRELCASAVYRRQERGLCSRKSASLHPENRDLAPTGRATVERVCCFSTPAPAPINPPHCKDNAEAQKWWIIFNSATNLLCSPGPILPSWWGLPLNRSTRYSCGISLHVYK